MGMSLIDNPVTEWTRCRSLDQRNIDRFKAAGVQIMALAKGPGGIGCCISQDRVEARDGRFEFERYVSHLDTTSAFVALAFDRDGVPADIVAWRPDRFIASWLGQVGLLGEEQISGPRLGEPLLVHADPLSWLRAGRHGVVVVDPIRAAALLRSVGTMEVGSYAERARLNDVMRVELPRIVVRSHSMMVAAE